MSFFFTPTPIQTPFFASPHAAVSRGTPCDAFALFNSLIGFPNNSQPAGCPPFHKSNPPSHFPEAETSIRIEKNVIGHRIEQLPDGSILFRPVYRQLTPDDERVEAAAAAAKKAHEEAQREAHHRRIEAYREEQRQFAIQRQNQRQAYEEQSQARRAEEQKAVQEFMSALLGAFVGQSDEKKGESSPRGTRQEHTTEKSQPIVEEPPSDHQDEENYDWFAPSLADLFNIHPLTNQTHCQRRRKSRRCKKQQSEQESQQSDQQTTTDPTATTTTTATTTATTTTTTPPTITPSIKKIVKIPAGANILDAVLQALQEVQSEQSEQSEQVESKQKEQEPINSDDGLTSSAAPDQSDVVAAVRESAEVTSAEDAQTLAIDDVALGNATDAVIEAKRDEAISQEERVQHNDALLAQEFGKPEQVENLTSLTAEPTVLQTTPARTIEPSPLPTEQPSSTPPTTPTTDDLNQNLLTKLFQQTEQLYHKRNALLTKIKHPDHNNNTTNPKSTAALHSALKQIDRLIEQTHQYTQQLLDEDGDDYQLVGANQPE